MTLRGRNILTLGLFGLLSASFVVFVVLLFNIEPGLKAAQNLIEDGRAHYVFFSWTLTPGVPYFNIVSPGVCIVVGWFATFLFLRNFRRVSSPQLFFFLLFWLSMGFEIVRTLNLYFLTQDLSVLARTVLTKIDTFGRLFASFALFAASLYATGLKVQGQGTILIVLVVVSAVLSYLVPFDSGTLGQSLLYLPADGFSLDVLRIVAAILTLLNFIKHAVTSRDSNELSTIVPVLLLLFGHELVYVSTSWIGTVVSLAALAGGTLWLTRRLMSDYMWY